ncbi:hypothetical protein [Mycobacterium sp. C31M]
MSSRVLMASTATATINAPADAVDVAAWLFQLTDAEYQRCAPGEHIAAGATTTDDGRLMSINVEHVGSALLIQHYVGVIVSPKHCRLVSESDNFTPVGRTKPRSTDCCGSSAVPAEEMLALIWADSYLGRLCRSLRSGTASARGLYDPGVIRA